MDIYETITKQNPSWGIAGFWWFFVFLLCFSRIIKQSYKSNKISFSQSLAYIAIYIYIFGRYWNLQFLPAFHRHILNMNFTYSGPGKHFLYIMTMRC